MAKKEPEGKYTEMLKQAQKDGRAKRVTPMFIEFKKEHDLIVGRLMGQQTIQSSKNVGSYQHYIVEADQGLVKFALGSATDGELAPVLKRGGVYAFEFLGQEDLGGGRRVNKFDVVELVDAFKPMEIPAAVSPQEKDALNPKGDVPF